MTAGSCYHPDAYSTSGLNRMGSNAAGESFLLGCLSYSRVSEFWAQVQKHEHAHHFANTVTGGPTLSPELVGQIPSQLQSFAFRSPAWLLKLGVLKVCS